MTTQSEARAIWNNVVSRPHPAVRHIGSTFSFGFDNAKGRTGVTKFAKRYIALSTAFLPNMTNEQVEQTILHEIAHAIAGPSAGHSEKWLRTARAIGYKGHRTAEASIKIAVEPLWRGEVRCCGIKIHAHRLTDRQKRLACRAHNTSIVWIKTR